MRPFSTRFVACGYFLEDLGPHCDLDLEDRNPNMLHNTPGHDDASTYQVSLRNVNGSEDFIWTNITRGFETSK